MDKTDIFGEFGLWVWGKSIPTDVDKCQIFMRQSPLGEYIKMFQAENKKLKEQQLTEDEIKKIFGYSAIGFIHDMDCPCKADPDDGDSYDECKCEALNNFAKKIIEAREEKNG